MNRPPGEGPRFAAALFLFEKSLKLGYSEGGIVRKELT
jgi:hypothetical protein